MTATLSILLYLKTIVCCTTYNQQTIDQFRASKHIDIVNIEQDPELYNNILIEYRSQAESIVVWQEVEY